MMDGPNESASSMTDAAVLKPTLFILRPLSSETRADVCLAAHFSPKDGQMVVNGRKQETSGAVLSHRTNNYFFAGFNRTIEKCELHGSSVKADRGTGDIFIPLDVCLQFLQLSLLHQAGQDAAQDAEQDAEQEAWTDSRGNLLLLQMNMLRVLLTKTVSLSTIVTIGALLR